VVCWWLILALPPCAAFAPSLIAPIRLARYFGGSNPAASLAICLSTPHGGGGSAKGPLISSAYRLEKPAVLVTNILHPAENVVQFFATARRLEMASLAPRHLVMWATR
jgi:hypothetical protein